MIAFTQIKKHKSFVFITFLVFKLLSPKEFVYKQKRQWKLLRVAYFLK